jgi:hypothetical protein
VSEWWTNRRHDGMIAFMHVVGEGAMYHQPFIFDEVQDHCPDCFQKVPDAIILGVKIGAL